MELSHPLSFQITTKPNVRSTQTFHQRMSPLCGYMLLKYYLKNQVPQTNPYGD